MDALIPHPPAAAAAVPQPRHRPGPALLRSATPRTASSDLSRRRVSDHCRPTPAAATEAGGRTRTPGAASGTAGKATSPSPAESMRRQWTRHLLLTAQGAERRNWEPTSCHRGRKVERDGVSKSLSASAVTMSRKDLVDLEARMDRAIAGHSGSVQVKRRRSAHAHAEAAMQQSHVLHLQDKRAIGRYPEALGPTCN
jgi:sarcosine oxidase delta subunit